MKVEGMADSTHYQARFEHKRMYLLLFYCIAETVVDRVNGSNRYNLHICTKQSTHILGSSKIINYIKDYMS